MIDLCKDSNQMSLLIGAIFGAVLVCVAFISPPYNDDIDELEDDL